METKVKWSAIECDLKDLKHWDKNPRTISKEAKARLKERLKERGMHDVLLITQDNVVLSGNQRLDVMLEEGVEKAHCLVPDRKLTDDEMTKIALESNISDGEWSYQSLLELKTDDIDLGELGFESRDILKLEAVMLEMDEDHDGSRKDPMDTKVGGDTLNNKDLDDDDSMGSFKYEMIFDSYEDKAFWNQFLAHLKINVEGDTIAERIINYLKEKGDV